MGGQANRTILGAVCTFYYFTTFVYRILRARGTLPSAKDLDQSPDHVNRFAGFAVLVDSSGYVIFARISIGVHCYVIFSVFHV